MGAEEVQVALEQDVTGDAYENLSFENIWANGKMDPSYYQGYEAFKNTDGTYQTDWMFDDNNTRQASNLMARYTTDVLQNRHDDNFVQRGGRGRGGKAANFIIGGQTFNARDFNNSFVPFINKLAKPSDGETFVSPTGMKFKFEKGKYYVYDANTRTIDEDKPMTFNDVAVSDGWANFLSDNSNKTTTGSGAADSL